jgi:hypothetical protein
MIVFDFTFTNTGDFSNWELSDEVTGAFVSATNTVILYGRSTGGAHVDALYIRKLY